jgi:hypothetical protein
MCEQLQEALADLGVGDPGYPGFDEVDDVAHVM